MRPKTTGLCCRADSTAPDLRPRPRDNQTLRPPKVSEKPRPCVYRQSPKVRSRTPEAPKPLACPPPSSRPRFPTRALPNSFQSGVILLASYPPRRERTSVSLLFPQLHNHVQSTAMRHCTLLPGSQCCLVRRQDFIRIEQPTEPRSHFCRGDNNNLRTYRVFVRSPRVKVAQVRRAIRSVGSLNLKNDLRALSGGQPVSGQKGYPPGSQLRKGELQVLIAGSATQATIFVQSLPSSKSGVAAVPPVNPVTRSQTLDASVVSGSYTDICSSVNTRRCPESTRNPSKSTSRTGFGKDAETSTSRT